MLANSHRRPPGRDRQRGLSLVEMLVGIAIGLIIVAAASMTVATQLSDNRRLLMEMQLQQDLRAATDVISRELRRVGFWANAGTQVAIPGTSPGDVSNPRRSMTPASGPTSIIEFEYDRKGVSPSTDGSNRFGFCYGGTCPSASPGMIRSKFAPVSGDLGINWHELTDDKAVNITSMNIEIPDPGTTPGTAPPAKLACPNLCADGSTTCWPRIAVREAIVTITGQSATDPTVQRTLTSRVRLRNDLVMLSVPGSGVAGALVACPS